ncbi:hypothetical protein FRC10_007797 [Ceratobasidium sp. 414]|nr:hypothetical protein FRC10_007797 [Ceratobasidium sp. 414]
MCCNAFLIVFVHVSIFHITLDLFQSSNGLDLLGLVLFRLAQASTPGEPIMIEQFVLECLSFTKSHTSKHLAKTVHKVLCKFKIEHWVWGTICDNASNNGLMMEKFKKMGMAQLQGPSCCLFCILHVYNLVAKAITLPYRVRHAQLDAATHAANPNNDGDDEIAELPPDEDDLDDDWTSLSANLEWVGDDEEEELPKMVAGSPEDKQHHGMTKALWKAAKEARWFRFTPGARREFKAVCEETGTLKLHSIRRDVQTRWNLTELMLEDTNHTWPALDPSRT